MTLSEFDGTILANNTEQDLFEVTTGPRHFAATVYLHNLVAGNIATIRVYIYDTNSGQQRLYDFFSYAGVQSEPAIFVPFLPTTQYRVTVQLSGLTQNITWTRHED